MKLWKKRQDKPQKTANIRLWSGVKNTAIAVLLVVNLVLLAALGCVKGYDTWIRHKTHQQIDSMLAKQGYSVRLQCVPRDGEHAAGIYPACR